MFVVVWLSLVCVLFTVWCNGVCELLKVMNYRDLNCIMFGICEAWFYI